MSIQFSWKKRFRFIGSQKGETSGQFVEARLDGPGFEFRQR